MPPPRAIEPALVSNPFDLRADRGLANFDVRNAAVISASYALPFGRGKQFVNSGKGAGQAVAGGWTINSIVTLQGGFPFTPQLSYNPSNNGDTRNPVRPFVNPAFTGPVILKAIRTNGSIRRRFSRLPRPAVFTAIWDAIRLSAPAWLPGICRYSRTPRCAKA